MPDLALEAEFHAQGHRLVAGVDEAGRGPLAGPVTAAAVILPPELDPETDWLRAIDDSKRLTPARRESAAESIRDNALAFAVHHVPCDEIDRIGIGRATLQAMFGAVHALRPAPDALLLDWIAVRQCSLPYRAVVKGDARSYSIAAASILAKTARDEVMIRADRQYPGYGFARHKGYATAQHRRCLSQLGPSPFHRRSFSPLRQGTLLADRHVS